VSRVAPVTMLPVNSIWIDSSGTPVNSVSSKSKSCRYLVVKALTFCFRNAQNGIHDHDDASAAEDQERAVRDLREHYWRELRNNEIEQPLCHQGCCHRKRANVVGLDNVSLLFSRRDDQMVDTYSALRTENERNRSPSKGVEDNE
jgi:hypothetical protein